MENQPAKPVDPSKMSVDEMSTWSSVRHDQDEEINRLELAFTELATRLRAAEADNAALKARAEAAEKVVADIDIALYPETDPYGEGDSFRADAMWDIHKIRQAARTPTPTPATGQEETR